MHAWEERGVLEEELSPVETTPAPERFARWTSITVAAVGVVILAAVATASTLMWTRPGARALLATEHGPVFAGTVLFLALACGLGFILTGTLHHHATRARILQDLTHEGLVEEASQEFDKVKENADRLAEAIGRAEGHIRRMSDRVDRLRRERGADEDRGTGSGPVTVNVLGRGSSAQEKDESSR